MHQDSPVPPGPPDFSYRKHHCSPSRVHRLVMFSNLYLSRICKDKTLFQLGVKFPHCLEKVESVVSRWESDHLSLFSTCSETHYGTKKYLQSVWGSGLHGFSLRVPLRHTWGRNVIHVHVFFWTVLLHVHTRPAQGKKDLPRLPAGPGVLRRHKHFEDFYDVLSPAWMCGERTALVSFSHCVAEEGSNCLLVQLGKGCVSLHWTVL